MTTRIQHWSMRLFLSTLLSLSVLGCKDPNPEIGDAGACACVAGSVEPCYSGPSGTQGVGACAAGQRQCNADGTGFGPCVGEVLPRAEQCNMLDDNCDGFVEGDLRPTLCATDFIAAANALVATVNAIEVPLNTRTPADRLPCPPDGGVGEGVLNIFSYFGPLNKSCNRMFADDCNEPARYNNWIGMGDDRRTPGNDSFHVTWGAFPLDYYYYGHCSPDPDAYDNADAGVKKLLQATRDANGDGMITTCVQTHVYYYKFFTVESGMRVYIPKDNIKAISPPFLADRSLVIPGSNATAYGEQLRSAYVTVMLTLKQPQDQTVLAHLENNHDGSAFMEWKDVVSCAVP